MVQVKILRPWGTPERVYNPGEIIDVPAGQADRMERTSPPFAERVKERAPISKRDAD